MFLLFLFSTPEPVVPEIELLISCNGPNTRKGKNGLCECVEGYNIGDPSSKFGCFRCEKQCHINASCYYPGKCICINGLVGDAVNNCIPPVPRLLSVNPNPYAPKTHKLINVSYDTPSNYSSLTGFCRFGKSIVSGIVLNDTISCAVPEITGKAIRVSISFNSKDWSLDDIVLSFQRPKSMVLPVSLIILSVIIVFIVRHKGLKQANEIRIDESTPFHKKGMFGDENKLSDGLYS